MTLLFESVRAISALAVTLGLLVGLAWLAKRYGLMQGRLPMASQGRLKLVEQLWLDAGRTRAVILRCDATEHLVIISPTGTSTLASMQATPLPKIESETSS